MAINSTTNLGLALPDQGEWDGTWGTNTNDQITTLIDSAVAGTTTLSADADVTLTDTDFAANQSRQAIILWTASNGATTRNITAPARSKVYVVVNAGTGAIVFRGAGPTAGVSIAAGRRSLVVWNGSDFAEVAGGLVNLTTQVTGTLPVANGGTGTASPSLVGGTNVTISGSFPNQTVNVTGGVTTNSIAQLDTNVTVADGITSFTGEVSPVTPFSIEATTSGTTLTVNRIQGTGTIVVGAVLSGYGVAPNTTITALGTGTGGVGTYTLSTSLTSSTPRTLTVTYSYLIVTAVTSGTLAIGQKITNKRTTSAANAVIPPNTYITAFATGSGGTGNYVVSNSFTLVSDTLYAGGAITNTADNNTATVVDGSGVSVRPVFTPSDWQGTIASGRMMGAYASRTVGGAAPFYFVDYDRNGSISAADALDVIRITSGPMVGSYPMAFSSAYGSNGVNAGLGFISLSNTDTLRAAVNLPVSSNVNAVVVGFSSAGSPPRIVISRASDSRPATINYNAQAHFFGNAGVAYTEPSTVTSSTLVLPFTAHYLTFNTTSTCTVTFPPAGTGAVVTGTVDDGSGTAAGTTLTVTNVTSGTLFVGMQLFSETYAGGTTPFTITAFGTGTGGVGTYTVSASLWFSMPVIFSPGIATGRRLILRNIASFAVNSASANVVPLAGGAAGTAILPATPGAWCELVFDGTDWQTMSGG